MRHVPKALLVLTTAFLLLLNQSCVSLTESGMQVVVAASNRVSECNPLGEVLAPPPFHSPNDAKYTLRNKAAELGGNAIVITKHNIGTARALVYFCKR